MSLERVTVGSSIAYVFGWICYYAITTKYIKMSWETASVLLFGLYVLSNICQTLYPFMMCKLGLTNPLVPKKCSFGYYGCENDTEWAIITGCTNGLGKSLTFKLASRGYNLLLIARNEALLTELIKDVESYGKIKAIGIIHDFNNTSSEMIIKFSNILINQIADKRIGLLVNNVGIANDITNEFCNYRVEEDYQLIDVNLKSMILMTQLVLPLMVNRQSGMVINVSSGSAYQASPYISTYGATKAFMRHFSNSLAKEYEKYGIKFYVCLPLFFLSNIVKEKQSILIPHSDEISDGILNHCTLVNESCPYLPHLIQHIAINCNWIPNLSFKFLNGLYKKRNNI